MRLKPKLKKIPRRRQQKKWKLDSLVTKVELFRKDIEEEVQCFRQGTTEERWENLKGVVMKSVEGNVGYLKGKVARKPWIMTAIMEKMQERRKWKNKNTEEGKRIYRRLNNELRRETDQARERWWKNECNELEELDRRARPDLVYAKVGQLTRKKTTNCTSEAIQDETGKLSTEPEEIRNRWKEYIETLYDKNGKPQNEEMGIELELDVDEDSKGLVILDNEVTNAIEALKIGKAIRPDGIPAEFWKVLGAKGTKALVELFKEMYVNGTWPSDFTRVLMIPLQKKMNAVECSD